MTGAKPQNKRSSDQMKLALIPVLAGVLLFVFPWPGRGHKTSVVDSGDNPRRATKEIGGQSVGAARERSSPGKSSPGKSSQDASPTQWPSVGIDDVLAYNPFEPLAIPSREKYESRVAEPSRLGGEGARGPVATELAGTKSTIEARKADAIYLSRGRRAAIIEAKVVRVGDYLKEGQVVEITSSEVVVDTSRARGR